MYSVVTMVVGTAEVTGVVAGDAVFSLAPVVHGTVVVIVLAEHPEVVSPAEFVPIEQTVVVIVVGVKLVTVVTAGVGAMVVK